MKMIRSVAITSTSTLMLLTSTVRADLHYAYSDVFEPGAGTYVALLGKKGD
jgi:hypothetical protein